MPYAPLNNGKCRELGCKNSKSSRSTFCLEHGGASTEKGKQNSKLYNSSYWKTQRKIQLSKNPLCAACLLESKIVQAEHIDHIFPHRQDKNKFKINIFQSLCIPHHTLKTQKENEGKYLHYSPKGLVIYTDADYGQAFNKTESAENI